MGISFVRATGRLFVPVVAVALLAGVSLEAGAYGSHGRIALKVASDLSTTQFVYGSRNSDEEWVDSSDTHDTQTFTASDRGCTIWETSTSLVNLIPNSDIVSGPTASSFLGFGPTSIGVYDGPTGVPCSRVSILKKTTETLGASLGSKVTTAKGSGGYGANAFDRLELDIEAKGNVELKLTVLFSALGTGFSRERYYYLRTGSRIVPGEGFDTLTSPGKESDPSNNIFNCSAASDSGNDSGPNDNCRWIINDWGQSFRIEPISGEFSLEGGGDFGEHWSDNRTFIYLTDILSGSMACGGTKSIEYDNGQYCEVTLKEYDGNNVCTMNYALLYGGDSCEFVTPVGKQVVANAKVAYEPEPAPAGSTDSESWVAAPLSRITFGKLGGSFPIPPCLGVTLTDRYNPDPIPEVRAGKTFGNTGSYDLIDNPEDTIEFACAFFRSENYVRPVGSSAGQNFIEEWVQFWSDPTIARGQN